MPIKIGKILIGVDYPPFIIAEMSGNHNQSLDRAIALVEAAANAGVQALKLQTYTADTMTIKGVFRIEDPNSPWDGRELYDLYVEGYTPWEWHEAIFRRARELNLEVFSTPFDITAVDFLESLDVPCYKISSFENSDWPLLEKVASTGKPIIMSTGASNLEEIATSVQFLRESGCKDLVLLKCTSTYPSSPESSNLITIPHMSKLFNCEVGLSDHTGGIGVAVASIALGARIIEKHFTLSRADGGVDSDFSMEPEEMSKLVIETQRAYLSLGEIQYDVQKSEQKSRFYKRSIYVSEDVKMGETIESHNVRVIRPSLGIAPKYYSKILGLTFSQNLEKGTPLQWYHFK